MPDTKQQINRGIDHTADQAKTLTDKIGATACNVAATVKDKVDAVKTGAADLADKAKDTMQEWTTTATDQARDMASCASAKAQDVGQEATRLVRQYPLQALLVSFGAGLVLSQLLRRS